MTSIQMSRTLRFMFPAVCILLFIVYFFRPWNGGMAQATWDIADGGDSILQAVVVKTMMESGWVFNNFRLGAPIGMNFYDFPGADVAILLQFKILTLIFDDPTVIVNVTYVLGFILIFISAYFVLRKFEVDVAWSTAFAMVFTCLPYHFLRGVNHLYLSSYYVVPVFILLAIRVYEVSEKNNSIAVSVKNRMLIPLLFCLGSSGVYYAFFGTALILVAATLGGIERKSFHPIRSGLLLAGFVCTATFANLLPNVLYRSINGSNVEVATRSAIESELYGLRMSQLLLPIWGHHSPGMASVGRTYHEMLRPVTEATSSALGVIGSCGFILLLLVTFLARNAVDDSRVVLLSKLNLWVFLFTAVGGAGVLFALFVTPQFRGMNRASVYIAFMAILALALLFKSKAYGWRKWFIKYPMLNYGCAILLILFSTYDQIPVGARVAGPAVPTISEKTQSVDFHRPLQSDFSKFITAIEGQVSQGAMIYQLPYLSFPESAPLYKEGYNTMLRPYYYSTHVRWSYGAMRGRPADLWQRALDEMPFASRMGALAESGFEGVYVERRAYADHGALIESELHEIAGMPVLESSDGYQAFYLLKAQSIHKLTPSMIIGRGEGFYELESDGSSSWMWSQKKSALQLYNFSDEAETAIFSTTSLSLDDRSLEISLNNQFVESYKLNAGRPISIKVRLKLKPGKNVLGLSTDKDNIKLDTDPRLLGFRIEPPVVAAASFSN